MKEQTPFGQVKRLHSGLSLNSNNSGIKVSEMNQIKNRTKDVLLKNSQIQVLALQGEAKTDSKPCMQHELPI